MTQNAFVEQMRAEHGEDYDPAKSLPGRRTVTFMGNTYDLAALGALGSGALVLFSRLTCNMGYYCLPLIPLLLGLVGVISAREAVNKERPQLKPVRFPLPLSLPESDIMYGSVINSHQGK